MFIVDVTPIIRAFQEASVFIIRFFMVFLNPYSYDKSLAGKMMLSASLVFYGFLLFILTHNILLEQKIGVVGKSVFVICAGVGYLLLLYGKRPFSLYKTIVDDNFEVAAFLFGILFLIASMYMSSFFINDYVENWFIRTVIYATLAVVFSYIAGIILGVLKILVEELAVSRFLCYAALFMSMFVFALIPMAFIVEKAYSINLNSYLRSMYL